MFGLSNLQIYGLQPTSATNNDTTNGMKMTANFLEKLIRNELLLGNSNNTNTNNNNCNNNNNNNNNIYNNGNNNKLMDSNKLTTNGNLDIYHQICNGIDDKENNNNNNSTSISNSSCSSKIDNGVTMNTITNKEINKDTINLMQTITKHNENDKEKESEKFLITNLNNDSSVRNSNEMTNEMNVIQNGTKISLDKQRKKFIQMITFLDQQNQRLEIELAKEKRRRGEELSKIVKSLLCFEAKLKHDKKVINQKLYEKDSEICKLINLNQVLKDKLGGAANLNNDNIIDDLEKIEEKLINEIQFCSNCRKKHYGLDKNHFGTQTYIEGDDFKDDQTEHGSSSDETVSSSFYGARRSIRYTSKRTFGTFRDYMRSRSMMVDDSNLDNSEENASTFSRDESQYSCFEKTNPYSRTIDRLHGVRRVESFDDDLDSESESNRNENDEKYFHNGTFTSSDKLLLSTEKNCSAKEFAEISPKQEFEMSTDDWYASASDAEENENVRAKPYTYNAVNPVLECVNQILLQQSMEECLNDGPPSLESNENNSGSGISNGNKENTVNRKRVHFSTKNSMVHVPRDDLSSPTDELEIPNQKDNSFNYESIYSNEYEPIGSEHNSSNLYVDMESKLGQDDRVIIAEKPKPPALPPKPANLMKIRRVLRIPPQPCPLRKIDAKIEEKSESEPDYCSISEVNEAITSVQIVVDVHKPPVEDDQSDALSQKTDEIEEIFADIPKLPNVAAIMAPKAISKYINNDNYITKSSPSKDDSIKVVNKSTPTHIPKILADINKKIATSTPTSAVTVSSKPPPVPPYSPTKATLSSSTVISAAIASSSSTLSSPLVTTPLSGKIIPTEDKLPLQAEFDWYNLDAEYGKSNQPDVIKATDTILNNNNNNNNDSNNNGRHRDNEKFKGINENDHQIITHGVEYNLDEEFSLTNQPDIIKENVLESKICRNNSTTSTTTTATATTTLKQTETVCEKFPTIVDQTPCNRRIKLRTDFTNFIENSGLSTKPLPRQRKIYFSGPFV